MFVFGGGAMKLAIFTPASFSLHTVCLTGQERKREGEEGWREGEEGWRERGKGLVTLQLPSCR